MERVEVEAGAEEAFEFWSDLKNVCALVQMTEETRRVDLSESLWRFWGPRGRLRHPKKPVKSESQPISVEDWSRRCLLFVLRLFLALRPQRRRLYDVELPCPPSQGREL